MQMNNILEIAESMVESKRASVKYLERRIELLEMNVLWTQASIKNFQAELKRETRELTNMEEHLKAEKEKAECPKK